MNTLQHAKVTTAKMSDETTGACLRAMREGAGMSSRELATGLGCTDAHRARIESGKRRLTTDICHWVAVEVVGYMNRNAA